MTPAPARLSIVDALDDPHVFGPWFSGASWRGWRIVLKGAFGLPMTDDEIKFFRTIAERDPPPHQVKELWIVAGRRAGKDSIASAIAAFLAAMFSDQDRLRPGERALVACLATDRDQAKIILNYSRAYFSAIEMLATMVTGDGTATGFELENGVDFQILTSNFRAVRGRAVLAAVLDECAFWRDDNSNNPDVEIYNALRPGLASLPGSMLVAISSPYAKSGLLYKKYRDHFGKNNQDVLIVRGATRALNPTIAQSVIDAATPDDPAAARAEWMAEFRDDLEAFVSREVLDGAVVPDRHELPRVAGIGYVGFVDPSGGSADSMTLAIAHREGDRVVLDALRESRPPFSPDQVVQDFSALLKAYGVASVTGDRYAGEWPRERFRVHGIRYEASERPKAEIYRDTLPMLNSGRIELLDHQRLMAQLGQLERRTSRAGRDLIDHPPGSHDDLANAAAGALLAAHAGAALLWNRAAMFREDGTPAVAPPRADLIFGVVVIGTDRRAAAAFFSYKKNSDRLGTPPLSVLNIEAASFVSSTFLRRVLVRLAEFHDAIKTPIPFTIFTSVALAAELRRLGFTGPVQAIDALTEDVLLPVAVSLHINDRRVQICAAAAAQDCDFFDGSMVDGERDPASTAVLAGIALAFDVGREAAQSA